jgi:hypothetical protein
LRRDIEIEEERTTVGVGVLEIGDEADTVREAGR